MRRFYKAVALEKTEGGFGLLLDAKLLKTPAQKPVILPTQKLADAIVEEWQAQGEQVVPATMPMMQFTATVLDHGAQNRADTVRRLLLYAESDLLCHRVALPAALRQMQDQHWDQPLGWLMQRYDIHLDVTDALLTVVQPEKSLERLEKVLGALNDWELMGVQTAALATGSIVLALMLYEKAISVDEAFEAAELETTYHIAQWGEDAELVKRRAAIRSELTNTALWLERIEFGP